MSIGTRAATCSQCGKRLNRKHWYYRNGKYYCKRRCWDTEQDKAAAETAKAPAGEHAPKEEAPKQDAQKKDEAPKKEQAPKNEEAGAST
jgi:hypothetical protein